DGTVELVDNPARWPSAGKIQKVEEPFVKATIITPNDHVGACMELCNDRRGTFVTMEYSRMDRVILTYELPLAEILMDFFDNLKSRTRGYASFDYELVGYRESQLVKMDIRINQEPVD